MEVRCGYRNNFKKGIKGNNKIWKEDVVIEIIFEGLTTTIMSRRDSSAVKILIYLVMGIKEN